MRAAELARDIGAIELLCAAQAIERLQPLASSAPLRAAPRAIRARVPACEHHRPPRPDIAGMIASGAVERACGGKVN